MDDVTIGEMLTAAHRGQVDYCAARENGVPKACAEQAAADSRGSRTCVCAITLLVDGSGTRRGGRINEHPAVVPSSRRGKNLQ